MKFFVSRVAGPTLLGALRVAGALVGKGPLFRLHVRLICRLVRQTGLFDEDWYRQMNHDVAGSSMDPVEHFVRYGDREGRWPMRLFDPSHYRSHVSPGCPKRLNSLLHYAWQGRFTGAWTSVWFDTDYYLAANRDVKFSRMNPLLHFVRFGWDEGRQPTEHFDRQRFLRTVAAQGDGAEDLRLGGMAEAEPPPDDVWATLSAPRPGDGPLCVDVIVPVYRGYAETLRCLHAVLSHPQQVAYELVVINDAGPDDALNAKLAQLAAQGLFTYLVNDSNLGFVGTVNRGMRLHPGRDVLLLNADAEPSGNWLDRMRDCAYRHERVATVTPLSNNATICSYPRFNQDNPHALEIRAEAVDALAARLNAGFSVPAPTAVGFCMYIRRQALDALGLFDVESFGPGYGEENDFCQRAIQAGWQNLITADTYVWHWGATSFQGTRRQRVRDAMDVLVARYPDYQQDVNRFIAADPLAPARRRLDEARLQAASGECNVLILTHMRGGGTERLIAGTIDALKAEGRGVYLLRSAEDGVVQLSAAGAAVMPNLPQVDAASLDALAEICRRFAIAEVHVHQLVDFPKETVSAIQALPTAAPGTSMRIFVHDYHAICPRINLADASGLYCGEPAEDQCNACLARPQGGAFPGLDIGSWRAGMGAFYETASEVVVPDTDVLTRLQRYFPAARFVLRSHEPAKTWPPLRIPVRNEDEPLRVVVIGAIGNLKGYNVLLACAQDAQARGLPVNFTLMGYSRNDRALRRAGVTLTGRYRDGDAESVLAGLDAEIVWLPSVWPETYSYTLSIALAAGMPVAAFDLGAIASRLRAEERGQMLMPLAWAGSPARINSAFIHHRARLAKGARDTTTAEHREIP